MELHYHPDSTYSRRVLMAAHEKGIFASEFAPNLVVVAMEKLAHKKKDFLALNPYGRVPVMKLDDGRILYESNIILQYMEARYPEPALLPADAVERASVLRQMLLADMEFARHMGVIIFPKRYLPEAKWDRNAMAVAAKAIKRHLKHLSAELGDAEWLSGTSFSLADISYAPFLEFRALIEIDIPENIEQWSQRMLARPSAAATKPGQ